MPVILIVTNKAEEASNDPAEYSFDQDRVTIGRGHENDLTLPDPRRIVSKEHAEIRCAEDGYQLVDRGSKNFTYLHSQRLEAGKPYELSEGDVFRVGGFEVMFKVAPSSEPSSSDQPMPTDSSSDSLESSIQRLIDVLNELTEAYEADSPERRDDALKDAMERVDPDVENPDIAQEALRVLNYLVSGEAGSPRDEEAVIFASSTSPQSPEADPEASATSDSPSPKPPVPGEEMMGMVTDTLVQSLSRIVEIPWQFRHEFIGQTIMESQETQFIYSGDAAEMKRHLLDPSISQEERRQRLNHVKDAAEDLAVHQVAMLNGYKASVTEGVEELLEELNPYHHREEVIDEHPIYGYIPMLASAGVIKRINDEWNDLKQDDWSAAEQRIFRPAFIKAYLARMTASDTK